jgi:glycosyltransferase involved in cell wall biosynthesis
VDVDAVTVYYFPLWFNAGFFYSPALAATITARLGEFDVAVLDGLWDHAMGPASRACIRAGVPYIMPLRGQLLPWALAQKYWKKRLYLGLFGRRFLNGAAALHCTDESEALAAARLGLKAPTFVVPNGVDATRFAVLPRRGGLRHRWGIPDEALLLLFIGRLHPQKRPDIAVECLAAAQSLHPGVHLGIAGPDEKGLSASLKAQAEGLGCAARLHLLGLLPRDEILQALADADLMLMPSDHQESFGMAAVEAMAAGVPVLVSDGVPVGRWAQEAGAGRVVPCGGQGFAQATCDLLSAPARLARMGEQGRRLVKERFDLPAVAGQMLAQFQAIAATGQPQ